MNPIVFAIPVFIASILLEVWIARRRGVRAYDAADALTSLHLGVLSQITGLFVKLAALGIYAFADERDGEKIIYGVRSPLRSLNPLWANLHYYADLWRSTGAAQGLRKKLKVWLAPPGAWTGEPLAHFDGGKFERYRPATPAPAAAYGVLQFALMAPCVMHLIATATSQPVPSLLLYALGIAFALLPDWFGYEAPLLLRATVLALTLGAAVWLDKNIKTHQWETI